MAGSNFWIVYYGFCYFFSVLVDVGCLNQILFQIGVG